MGTKEGMAQTGRERLRRRRRPCILEVNTWTWLETLSRRYDRPVTLGSVPDPEWSRLMRPGIDAVWLMGVWERSPASRRIAAQHPDLQPGYHEALGDFETRDVVGSPYSVRRYRVARSLGGARGLATARRELDRRGAGLILDFVPNHVAVDHPWVEAHPDFFVDGDGHQAAFAATGGRIAHGRDPYFPAWTDTAQLNALSAELRHAAAEVVESIAAQCDGVRCDMAMLMLNRIFRRTWPEVQPGTGVEYWTDVINAVRNRFPEFLFLAEAYWDTEWELLQLGFDFCYDKRLYDRLVTGDGAGVREHLSASPEFQERLVRFLENHDEPRVARRLDNDRQRSAAVVWATLPGARLLHEGQAEGAQLRLPVQLGRRPHETRDEDLARFYGALQGETAIPVFRDGVWSLCSTSGWPDNQSHKHLCAWTLEHEGVRRIVVVNLSDRPAQARVHLPWPDLAGRRWTLREVLDSRQFEWDGTELARAGLFVDLPPWRFHLMAVRRESP